MTRQAGDEDTHSLCSRGSGSHGRQVQLGREEKGDLELGPPKVERGDHSSTIGPFSQSFGPWRIRSDGGGGGGGEHVPPSMGEGWPLLLLTPLKGAGFCNVLGVVGEKSGAGRREFRVVLI